jgi:lipoprotein NlpD
VRVTRAIGVIGVSCALGFGCATPVNYAPETYVVRPQDTLYSIAWRHDLDYHDLARWNGIGPDYRIAIGQVLQLKPTTHQLAARPPPSAPHSVSPSAPPSAPTHPHDVPRVSPPQPLPSAPTAAAGAPRAPSTGAAEATKPPGAPSGALQWVWPTEHSAAPRSVPGGGILLLGQLGQAVRAACSGRVVYTGSGLRGYGNLIIIKHGDNLLSAYAHNRELLVREGQDVVSGQAIAQMGTGPHQIAALYFEIRLNGKPVDPLPYLPVTK